MSRWRWHWQHWRAAHVRLKAEQDYATEPSPANREARAIARLHLERLELNRP